MKISRPLTHNLLRGYIPGTLCAAIILCSGNVRAQTQNQGDYRISGTAVNAATGQPLDRAAVSLSLVKGSSVVGSMQTGPDGHFVFDHLPAAKYALTGSHRGFVTGSYDEHEQYSTAIVTGKSLASENLSLRLVPDAVISGTVLEDSGDPVENARIMLYRQTNDSGIEKVRQISSTNADDNGAYEFTGLAPGDYFIAASGRPWYADNQAASRQRNIHSPLDLVYATTFYADVNSADDATPIPLKGNDRVQVNFTLHPVPALHLIVHTSVPEDMRRRGMMAAPTLTQQIFGATEYIETNSRYIAPGETEISVAPGEYQIHLSGGPGPSSERLTTVDLTSDQAVDTSTGVLTAGITGKLATVSGEALPPNTLVSLTSADGIGNNGAVVAGDGTFSLANVAPGRYRLNGWMNGKRLFVARIAATGAEIDQQETGRQWIKVGSDPVMLAATVYPDPNLEITGFAMKDGKPASGAMIVLVPANPGDNRDLFRRDQSDSDGSFTLQDVIPGKYTVVAIQDGWTLNWAEPEVIAHYLPAGQYVTVTERNATTIELRQRVEVQPK